MATKTKVPLKERRPLFDQFNTIRTEFLGWEKPILHSACDFLESKYRRAQNWDMSRCIVVLPGALAGRRLATLLAQRAQRDSLVIRPPDIITVGKLPEMLYSARLPFASDLEQTLAWTKVLRNADAEFLRPLLVELPDRNEVRPWIDLAKLLSSLHRELSSDLVDFSDVKGEIHDPREIARWEILADLQLRYLAELHEAGLWDLQTARRYAIDQKEVKSEREIILIGAVDLNQAQRRFLDQVAEDVQVLVGAPKSFEGGFHADGTLSPEFWQDLGIDIPSSQIHVRATATEAAREMANQFALLGDSYSVADITIGIPDPSIVPVFQETLSDYGVTLRYGPGEPLAKSSPMKLLETVIEYVSTGSIEAFNQLVRIPSLEQWLAEQPKILDLLTKNSKFPSLLTSLDRYQESTLIRTTLQMEWPEMPGRELFIATVEVLEQWLQPLRESSQPLEQWAEPIRQVLRTAYMPLHVDPDTHLGNSYLRATHQINAMLDCLQSLPSNLDATVTLLEAYTWLLGQLESGQIPPLHAPNEIEMLGWLDLALDDAPVLILTGLQDGIVPESVNGDAFLPNQLRSILGLMDNSRRYARDCYAMLTMLHTRERLEILLNHLGLEGDPQTPSRILMSVPPDELAPRVRWLLEPQPTESILELAPTWRPRQGQTNIPIPVPVVESPIQDMAVTDFKKYDQCPYRFYLGKIQKARAFEHERLELDGGGFGDLVHKTLECLFNNPIASSSDPAAVEAFLVEALRELAKKQFGVQRSPALVIQLEQAERRLKEFSIHQANWAAQGWVTKWIEHTVTKEDKVYIPCSNGRQMLIHGRIDRIDYNEKLDRYAVLDYKTGDTTDKPRANHLKGETWIDWQLPLYGQLIQTIKIAEDRKLTDLSKVLFGYILLPKNPAETQFILADFTLEELKAAIESAGKIASKVLDSEFWPPRYKQIHQLDPYNGITQRSVARRWDRAMEEQEDAPVEVTPLEVADAPDIVAASLDETKQPAVIDHGQGCGPGVSPGVAKVASGVSPVIDLGPGRSIVIHRGTGVSSMLPSPTKIRIEPHKAKGTPPPDWYSAKMILASAGTGKTFNLASRALRLLFTDQSLDSILATTFTRKAAGEILHRVLMWLAKGVDDPKSLAQLQQVLEPLEIDAETVKYQLSRLCSQLHRFRVSTLDSFYSQLARSFALELKLPPGWSLADPFRTEQLKHEAISRMFENIPHDQLRSLVSQLSKGEATRSIRREIETVVSTGYDLYRRTSREAWEGLQVPKSPPKELVEESLLAFRNSEVKDKRYPTSRDRAASFFETQEWGDFLGHTLVQKLEADVPKFYHAELGSEIIDSLRVLAKKALSEELASRRAKNKAAYDLLEGYHQQMQIVKSRHRVVTFDDISERLSNWMLSVIDSAGEGTHEAAQNLENRTDHGKPSMESISYRLDCPIDHLLLDEFQDTSPVQWEIVKPFAEAIVQNSAGKTSFFCVGDTKQAIYGWRGGVSEIFESVGVQIRNVQKEQLIKSYRSSQVIIDFVNSVFTQLDKHEGYSSSTSGGELGETEAILQWVSKNFQPHETSHETLPGYVEIRNANIDKEKEKGQEEEETDELLEEIVDRIAQLHREAPHIEIGVLSRTNQDIGFIINMLRERGIEASQEGGNPLTDSSAVLLIQSAMRVANHPADSLAFFHVCNSPLAKHFSAEGLASAEQMSSELRTIIDAFGFGDTVSQLAHTLAPECNARDQDRLRQLIQLGYRFDGMSIGSIFDFIEFIDQSRVALPGANKIRVMTIHQSKGLEFDAVFLPSLSQGMLSRAPNFVPMFGDRTKPPIGVSRYISQPLHKYLSKDWELAFREYNNQQLAEALCLFYVALTRAKQALYLYTIPAKSSTRQWGSVLQSIFGTKDQRNSPGILIHSWGDSEWYKDGSGSGVSPEAEQTTLGETPEPQTERALKIQLRGSGERGRGLPALRPSQKESAKQVALGWQWESIDSSGAVIGKLIHRWFEEVTGWIEDFKPSKKHLKEIAASSLTQEEMNQIQVSAWIDRFIAYSQLPGVRNVLSQSRYDAWHVPRVLRLEVSNERKLLQILDDSLLRGVIDRCVVAYDGDRVVRAEIIDFKTDQRPKKLDLQQWVESRREYHYPQLAIYRRALAEQYQLDPKAIQLTLVLLSEDQIVNVLNHGLHGGHG